MPFPLTRRSWLGAAALAAATACTGTAAWAQAAYPNKPIKVVVPFVKGVEKTTAHSVRKIET